ncbi:MAG: polyketide synthase dehydratase domain-containing protein, partial [Chloroflexota bacterium]
GQSDYSAANDLLCKITSSMRRRRPETKAIAIDWTAWGDIGMAARGSVPTVMKALGIDMLPPASGVPTVRRELTAGGFSGEVLVAGELGVMVNEIDATGGLDVTKANQWLAEKNGDLLMAGQITGAPLYGGLQIETTLDPAVQPFLFDHVPDEETPWLPGVMAIEGLAEAAALLAPGFHVDSVRHVEMSGAFKFFHSEPRTLYLNVFAEPGQDGTLAARVTLHSITAPAREGLPMRTQVHFRAGVPLASQISAMPDVEFTPPENAEMPTTAEQIYKIFFHGPAYQVIERAGVSGSRAVSRMADQLPTDREPAGARMLMAPRLVELCFQSAAQWSVETKEAMAFPIGVESLSVYLQENDTGAARLFALVNTEDDGETFDARVVDENGRVYVDLRGYRTVSRPGLQ